MRVSFFFFVYLLFSCAYAQTWNEVKKITASDRQATANYGLTSSISGNYAIVGSPYRTSATGVAYIYERAPNGNWNLAQRVEALDKMATDEFGYSVAISGNYAIVGARVEDHDAAGGSFKQDAGSAYIFERDSTGAWSQAQKIVASDRQDIDNFGWSVAIDGNFAVVGAYWEDHDTAGGNQISKAGSAYIFERDGTGTWNEVQKIVAADRAIDDFFGHAVAVHGNFLIVGANAEDEDTMGTNTLAEAGSAYIFERDSTGYWSQVQKIVASDRSTNDWFGSSVTIDSNYIVIGVNRQERDAAGLNNMWEAGAAYIYKRDTVGKWNQVQKIVAADRKDFDWFGYAVSISGNYLLVGAPFEDEDPSGGNYMLNAGSAYLFEKDTNGVWNQKQKIVASDREADDSFGFSVSLSGNYLLIGAPFEDEDTAGLNTFPETGSAYIFKLTNPPLNVNITGNDTAICYGDSLSLVSVATGGVPPYSYSWSTGDTTSSILITESIDTSARYDVYVTDSLDNVAMDSVWVYVFIPPQVSLGNDTMLCPGDTILLDAGIGSATYIWSTGQTTQMIMITTPGIFWVQVTDNNGCSNNDTINIASCLSIDEINVKDIVTITPNPFRSSTEIVIASKQETLNRKLVFSMYDMLGRNIQQFDVSGFKFNVERGNLPEGFYFFRIQSEEEVLGIGKLVIQD